MSLVQSRSEDPVYLQWLLASLRSQTRQAWVQGGPEVHLLPPRKPTLRYQVFECFIFLLFAFTKSVVTKKGMVGCGRQSTGEWRCRSVQGACVHEHAQAFHTE